MDHLRLPLLQLANKRLDTAHIHTIRAVRFLSQVIIDVNFLSVMPAIVVVAIPVIRKRRHGMEPTTLDATTFSLLVF